MISERRGACHHPRDWNDLLVSAEGLPSAELSPWCQLLGVGIKQLYNIIARYC